MDASTPETSVDVMNNHHQQLTRSFAMIIYSFFAIFNLSQAVL